MFWLIVLGWVAGIGLVGWGVFGLIFTAFFVKANKEVTKVEIEMMKEHGLFEGEPEDMRDFRVARSEWDLESDPRMIWLFSLLPYGAPLLIGLVLLAFLIMKARL